MAIYAIGDVQGCYKPLRRLLDKLKFDDAKDTVWFTGDLVNRGPDSLKTLRFVRSLGSSAITVLGNHDLHLLAAHITGNNRKNGRDTLDKVLHAHDREDLLHWLRQRPFMHADWNINTVMVHAGLAPHWSIKQSLGQARKLERILQGDHADKLLRLMYTETPRKWGVHLDKWQRRQYALAVFTRLRYINVKGRLEMAQKGPPGSQTERTIPWFEASRPRWQGQARVVFGHWSTLGRVERDDIVGLDSGCVWGGALTAVRLTKKTKLKFTKVSCSSTVR